MMMPDQAKAVFCWWEELTGQHLRVPTFIQARQAMTVALNFTRDDLEATVRYVRRQIADNENNGRRGLNARSMTWTNFFGQYEECERFQENLALMESLRKKPVAKPEQPQPVSEEDRERIARQARELAQKAGVRL